MKKIIALLLSVLMILSGGLSAFAADSAMFGSLIDRVANYDAAERKSLIENIAVFSGAEQNLETACGQIDSQSGMIYDLAKPMVDELGADAVKAAIRSIAAFGCAEVQISLYAYADAKTETQPLAITNKVKSGMQELSAALGRYNSKLKATLTTDGINESVLAYILTNMYENVKYNSLFAYDEADGAFSVRSVSSAFRTKFDSIWQGITLGGKTMTADGLLANFAQLLNAYTNKTQGMTIARALEELGLCAITEDSGGSGTGTGTGTGTGNTKPGIDTPATEPTEDEFTDLANYSWAKDAIYELRDKGIINGTSKTTYSPANNIKRGDFILILARMLEITGGTDNFADVPVGSYYYDAISAAKAAGIAKGDGDNFMPEATITRQDLITLAYRAFLEQGVIEASDNVSVLDAFSDKDLISGYAKEAMASMVAAGIIQGSDGGVNPLGNATRAEVAVMCARLLSLMK
ncbi:MAG: S-layer homology domain-containing protein [Clostridia bacterium]|nr:S-layer homology domain-containing protein [Clostridia bacterium]